MRPIVDVCDAYSIDRDYIIPYGRYKAKLSWEYIKSVSNRQAKYVLITATTPTKSGLGKTSTTIGLADAFSSCGEKAICCIRQPSLGPYLGMKGAGTGGGMCKALPEEDINLHFTGDNYAVSTAHNLLASVIDNHIFRGNELKFNLSFLNWNRAIDVSDGALAETIVGLAWEDRSVFYPRKTSFCITAASEIMSILALSKDAADVKDAIENIVVGFDVANNPIKTKDIGVANAVYKLVENAISPNVVQTTGGSLCFIHAGPFANISIGSNSIIADTMALALADYVITESGFGMDCGGEKFFNIKSRRMGRVPDVIVVVSTAESFLQYGEDAFRCQIENSLIFGRPVVLCINRKKADDAEALDGMRRIAKDAGVRAVVDSFLYDKGAEGGRELAEAVREACALSESSCRFTYQLNESIEEKAEAVAKTFYRAKGIAFSDMAKQKLRLFKDAGYNGLYICFAKTPFSLGHSSSLGPAPRDYVFENHDAILNAGAGFIVLLSGNIKTLPGLPARPRVLDF